MKVAADIPKKMVNIKEGQGLLRADISFAQMSEEHFENQHEKNTSLAAKGALAHHLQITKWPPGGPKWPTGSGKGSNPRLLGAPVNFL